MTVFFITVFFFALILTGIRGYRDRMWSAAEKADRQYKDCYRIGQMLHNYLFFIREIFPIQSQIENLRADKKKNRNEIQSLEDQCTSARSQAFHKSLTVSEIQDEECEILFNRIRNVISNANNSKEDIVNFSKIIAKRRNELYSIEDLKSLHTELLDTQFNRDYNP